MTEYVDEEVYKKFTKTHLLNSIDIFLKKRGERITNINKATKNNLLDVIKKYNIPINKTIIIKEVEEYKSKFSDIRVEEKKEEKEFTKEELLEYAMNMKKNLLIKGDIEWDEENKCYRCGIFNFVKF